MKLHLLAVALLATLSIGPGCVTVDAETNEVIPRGDQRYKFSTVKEYSKDLKQGMTKLQVLSTVGSPAEKSERGDVWVYLPERSAILIPSKALKLHFEDNALTEFGFHAIVLGAQL
ncbi:MAG: hypothetical protein P8R43_03165 [Planctomycetota bacterium]|nr:hypothetical protein [Planctomycetota bacterium]